MALGALLLSGCAAPAAPAQAQQGVPFTDGGLRMTVQSASKVLNPDADNPGWWVVVKVHLHNDSQPLAFFSPTEQVLSVDGHPVQPRPAVAEAIDDTTTSAAALLPGESAEVALAYVLTPDVFDVEHRPVALLLRGSEESAGTSVGLDVQQPLQCAAACSLG